jgi:hypothetical protein
MDRTTDQTIAARDCALSAPGFVLILTHRHKIRTPSAQDWLPAACRVRQQIQSAATRDNLTALTDALARIQIPAPKVDLTPVLAAIEKLAEQKPREWKFKIKRNAVGGISEVIATAQ